MKKIIEIILLAVLSLILALNSNIVKVHASSHSLNGIYKCDGDTKYTDTDDGTPDPMYFYFASNHQVKYACPKVTSDSDSDTFYYGEAAVGNWKYIGDDTFEIKLSNVYNSGHYDYEAWFKHGKLHMVSKQDNPAYTLGDPINIYKIDMNQGDFEETFTQAKSSEKEGVSENGTQKPHDYETFDN